MVFVLGSASPRTRLRPRTGEFIVCLFWIRFIYLVVLGLRRPMSSSPLRSWRGWWWRIARPKVGGVRFSAGRFRVRRRQTRAACMMWCFGKITENKNNNRKI